MPTPERHQLTLSQLAEFDDLLTDSLIDRVYYWTTIRKMKHTYHPNRGVKTDAVTKIIVNEAVRNKSVASALQQFLELAGIRQFLGRLSKNENLKADFIKHTRRYLSIYLLDCPFEVSATNRYNLTRPEACVLARKLLRKGDTIKYLTGAMVKMSEQEEEAYTHGKTDFSIIYSSRVGGMSLLLGPARFVNHDCEPNAKFITSNKDNIHLLVLRDIELGHEINVRYADDYFGNNNKECLCQTCEAEGRNGWAPEVKVEDEEDARSLEMESADSIGAPGMRRTRSKRKNDEAVQLLPYSQEKRTKRKAPKDEVLTPPDSDRAMSEDPKLSKSFGEPVTIEPKLNFSPAAAEIPPTPNTTSGTPICNIDLSTSEADIAESLLALAQSPGFHKPLSFSPQPSVTHSFVPRHPELGRVLSYDGGQTSSKPELGSMGSTDTTDIQQSATAQLLPATSAIAENLGEGAVQRAVPIMATNRAPSNDPSIGTLPSPQWPVEANAALASNVESDLSEISDTEFSRLDTAFEGSAQRNQKSAKPKHTESFGRRKSVGSVPPPPNEPIRKRTPGDYIDFFDSDCIKCNCADCHEDFIHGDRWYVPRSCQRCERHSKIYGLVWPKTVRKKGDSEDQIEDHRMVQRYVTASEHRKEQKRLAEAQTTSGHAQLLPTARRGKR